MPQPSRRWLLATAFLLGSLALSAAFQPSRQVACGVLSGGGGRRPSCPCRSGRVRVLEPRCLAEAGGLKTWDELRALAGPVPDRVVVGDSLSGTGDLPTGLTLFRDRNGWCPYSERVWVAMLAKQLDFDEVLINLQVRGSTSGFLACILRGSCALAREPLPAMRSLARHALACPPCARLPACPPCARLPAKRMAGQPHGGPRGTDPCGRTQQHRRTQGTKPRWYTQVNPSGQTPCVRTADGRVITESLRIIESLDAMFPDGPQLFPADAALKEEALKLMNSFSSVFPSGTRPSSRGSFLYKGQETPKHVHAGAPARDPTDATRPVALCCAAGRSRMQECRCVCF